MPAGGGECPAFHIRHFNLASPRDRLAGHHADQLFGRGPSQVFFVGFHDIKGAVNLRDGGGGTHAKNGDITGDSHARHREVAVVPSEPMHARC